MDVGLVLSESFKMLVGVVNQIHDGHRGGSARGLRGVDFLNGLSGGA
jgi:hypothetical protein